jgi:hypothetical protein
MFAKLPYPLAQTLCEWGQTLSPWVGLPCERDEPLCERGETLGLFAQRLYEEGEPLRACVETP